MINNTKIEPKTRQKGTKIDLKMSWPRGVFKKSYITVRSIWNCILNQILLFTMIKKLKQKNHKL